MLNSLFFHPATMTDLWRQSVMGARQPARRDFALSEFALEGEAISVVATEEERSPFYNLLTFVRDGAAPQRGILLIPPMSSAFPFLVRDMAARLVGDARVHVLEWINARHVPEEAGSFDFESQVDAIEATIRSLGPETHVVALCQSGAPTLIACADLAARAPEAAAASLSIIGAPIEPHAAESMVSKSMGSHSLGWYRDRLSARVPPLGGRGRRRVYPAEAQLSLLYSVLAKQDPERDELSRMMLHDEGVDPAGASFLDVATSLMDLPGEHFVQNIERIYLDTRPTAQRLTRRGEPVAFKALARTPMMTVEGERDLVAAPGQTAPALTLCPAEPGVARRALIVEKTGHFGLFYGRRWRSEVAPRLIALMSHADRLRAQRDRDASEEGAPEGEAPSEAPDTYRASA